MITVDQQNIGKEVTLRLGANRCILDANHLNDKTVSEEEGLCIIMNTLAVSSKSYQVQVPCGRGVTSEWYSIQHG